MTGSINRLSGKAVFLKISSKRAHFEQIITLCIAAYVKSILCITKDKQINEKQETALEELKWHDVLYVLPCVHLFILDFLCMYSDANQNSSESKYCRSLNAREAP